MLYTVETSELPNCSSHRWHLNDQRRIADSSAVHGFFVASDDGADKVDAKGVFRFCVVFKVTFFWTDSETPAGW